MKDTVRDRIIASRAGLLSGGAMTPSRKSQEEGGCGVVGLASSVPVGGRHIFAPSIQMHNRGNGKGGGITATCLDPAQLGVDAATLRDAYLLQIALLDPKAEREVDEQHVRSCFQVAHRERVVPVCEYGDLGLAVKPPDVVRYFVRVKDDVLSRFADEHRLPAGPARAIEDEFVYQNSYRLNQRFYASLGEKRAFVLCHARDLILFKIVGYAEQVVQYYGLEDVRARVWVAHQRYPTKGRVWHPGGSHPFIGMNEALVHNGDFANYFSVCEYLRQHNVQTQFLTDTEVSVLLFDLWSRVYGYPLEYVMETMAPTTDLDFDQLPANKQRVYRALQALHMHGSPDGPWFFIIARSDPDRGQFQLLGITDTSMLRPQVFAWQEGDVTIGLVASEKQAIDATLRSLRDEDERFRKVADRYWNARGGSYTDGGAFVFSLEPNNGAYALSCADKFGRLITAPGGDYHIGPPAKPPARSAVSRLGNGLEKVFDQHDALGVFNRIAGADGAQQTGLSRWTLGNVRWFTDRLVRFGSKNDDAFRKALELLGHLNDRRYDCGELRPSAVLEVVQDAIAMLLDAVPLIGRDAQGGSPLHAYQRITWDTRDRLRPPRAGETVLVVDAKGFPPEGLDCDSRLEVRAWQSGWRRFIVYGLTGQRFTGCGFGPRTAGGRMDIYGSSGDYLGSGIDGMEIHVHGSGQDQIAQIMKSGRLVVYGDVGQAFMYGAKGGEVYVMGNAAGRPLINAVGGPRVVINGVCLDFLAESFMAGEPHTGGGFVILNGIKFDDRGAVRRQDTPYPGANLFSLASGGAIYMRDPYRQVKDDVLNGGVFVEMTQADWRLILPYLQANERYFGIAIERDLLTVDGAPRSPSEVYRKVQAVKLPVLEKEAVPE